jgi:flagellar basal body-associated protein FliL
MAWYDDPTIIIIILLVVIVAITASMSLLFGMKLRGKKKPEPEQKPLRNPKSSLDLEFTTNSTSQYANSPFRISKSVQANTASSAKDELRILDLEREILGDSIRRLYEAQAEGKITEAERDRLAVTYKNRMNTIKESIAKDETIVALHELEGMQEDLMTLFSERFGELTSKVDELRGRIDIKPIKEIPIKLPTPAPTQMESEDEEEEEETSEAGEEDKPKKKPQQQQRKPAVEKPDAKSEAEKRIESIRSEVEKVLDKLGQMEIES